MLMSINSFWFIIYESKNDIFITEMHNLSILLDLYSAFLSLLLPQSSLQLSHIDTQIHTPVKAAARQGPPYPAGCNLLLRVVFLIINTVS